MIKKTKILLSFLPVILLTGCGSEVKANTKGTFVVTDFLDREVRIVNNPKKFVCIGPGALRQYSYVGDPSKIIAIEETETKSSAASTKPYMNLYPNAKNLPIIGVGGKDNNTNAEKILQLQPDVIFSAYLNEKDMDLLSKTTKTPVVAVAHNSTGLFAKDIYESLELIGQITGRLDKTNDIIDYFETSKSELENKVKNSPNQNKLGYIGSINYRGQHDITYTTGNFPIFDVLNIRNLAKEEGLTTFGDISIETLRDKKPDKIIVDAGGLEKLNADLEKRPGVYKDIQAFKNKEVYVELPFVFYSANFEVALANAYYIGSVFYPEAFPNFDIEAKFNEITQKFYGQDLYSKMVEHFKTGYGKLEYTLE